jgi:hypothetical protein
MKVLIELDQFLRMLLGPILRLRGPGSSGESEKYSEDKEKEAAHGAIPKGAGSHANGLERRRLPV